MEPGGSTLQVNQMGPRGRLTLDGPSLEIRLRKTDKAMPKHAGGPRLGARSLQLMHLSKQLACSALLPKGAQVFLTKLDVFGSLA